jgi:hypothetical protein
MVYAVVTVASDSLFSMSDGVVVALECGVYFRHQTVGERIVGILLQLLPQGSIGALEMTLLDEIGDGISAKGQCGREDQEG